MTTVAYFISPHGFGHAARATAVMQAIQRRDPAANFLVFTSVPGWFFADQGIQHLEIIHSNHDVGLVQTTPFQEDLPATLKQLDEIYPYTVNQIQQTVDLLKENSVDLVICDIAPLGLVAARQVGIPSLLIENFTWDWIYQPFIDDYPQFKLFIDHFRSLYPLSAFHIQTEPICNRIENLPKLEPLIARNFRTSPGKIRSQLGIKEGKQLVLISFGGNREQFKDLTFLKGYQNTIFLLAGQGEQLQRQNNVIALPHHAPFYHPDLIQAADIIIGKAGYSTLAEVALAGKPFAFISRDRNMESAILAKHIHQYLPSIEISQTDYLSHHWINQIPDILKLQPTAPAEINGADLVADYIFSEILYSS